MYNTNTTRPRRNYRQDHHLVMPVLYMLTFTTRPIYHITRIRQVFLCDFCQICLKLVSKTLCSCCIIILQHDICESAGENVNGMGTKEKWWAQRDLNPRPSDYESPALTAELWAHRKAPELYRNEVLKASSIPFIYSKWSFFEVLLI